MTPTDRTLKAICGMAAASDRGGWFSRLAGLCRTFIIDRVSELACARLCDLNLVERFIVVHGKGCGHYRRNFNLSENGAMLGN